MGISLKINLKKSFLIWVGEETAYFKNLITAMGFLQGSQTPYSLLCKYYVFLKTIHGSHV